MKINNKIAKKLKRDFPIFRNNPGLIYLDSAATSQRPKQVIKKLVNFYEKENANAGRGLYTLAEKAMIDYSKTRKIIANFINAEEKEIIFTRNTTESLNLLAYTIFSMLPKGRNEIVLTEMEHHSNIVPWQQLAKRNNMILKFIKIKSDFTLDINDAMQKITDKTAILSFTHVSNVLGTINDINLLTKLGKSKGAIVIIDAAQSVQNTKIDVKKINCDFLVFSSHKMLGPTGIGILYGKKELLEKLSPFNFGGGMIKKVSWQNSEWADIPEKFEAGTQNIAEAIALGEAIKYIRKIGIENINNWEKELTNYALSKLKEIPLIKIYNQGANKSSAIISFNLRGIHPHDVSELLNEKKIAIRAGHCCAMPLMEKLQTLQGVCRISFSIYNTFEDINRLVDVLKSIVKRFE
ncbi:MAG: SufS family cysteine desulfurase [Nanoarchaeota archaeon]